MVDSSDPKVDSSNPKLSTKEQKLKIMELLDKDTPSPEVRARFLLDTIRSTGVKPTQWDLVCFCVETLGSILGDYEVLKPLVKRLAQLVYTIHYTNKEELASCVNLKSQTSLIQEETQTNTSSTETPK